jgi:hypothetical protein
VTKTREAFSTPVGRLVQGDCFAPQTKDQQGNLRVFKSGPNVGQPNPQFFISVAFPKIDPQNPALQNQEFAAFYALLDRVARAEWPSLFPTPGQPSVNPMFTMKVKDGDGIDRNGKSNATKEGFPGHWIVSFASAYAPKVVRETSPGVWETLTDPASVKRGYFVRVAGSATGNDSPNTPGIYVNLDMVALIGYGPEIVSGPDAATAFGAPAAMPAGVSAVPIGGAMPAAPGAPGIPAIPGAPGVPLAAPVVPLSPAVALPVPVSGPVMTAAATATYEAYVAAGWSDAQLIAAGFMVAPMAAPAVPLTVAAPVAAAAPVQPYTGYMGVPGATPGAPPAPLAVAPIAAPPSLPTPAIPLSPSAPIATTSLSRAMTALAEGKPYESFVAAGWTDAQLVQHGYMTA